MFKSTSQTVLAYFLSALVLVSTVGPVMASAARVENGYQNFRTGISYFASSKNLLSDFDVNSVDVAMLPGGPDQPESSSFTPIGVSDMVDPFTGSFTYNIPLMDVDGYPLNLAYTGNSGMNAEASWVGLGWSLNPGAVNRNMRGLPDDFKGDVMEKESNKKTDFTLGVTGSITTEIFGLDKIPGAEVQLSAQAALEYNNYTGFGANWTISPSLSLFSKEKGKDKSGKLNLSLGLSGSSTSGPSINPGISYSTQDKLKTLSIGMPYSSRQGIQELSYSLDIRSGKSKTAKNLVNAQKGWTRDDVNLGRSSIGSSFNFMQATYTPNLPNNRLTAGFTFKGKLSPDLFGADLPAATLGGYIRFAKDLEKNLSSPAYGYIYMGEGDSRDDVTLDFNRENDGPYTKGTPTIGLPVTTADIFTVSAQGIGGSYMPFTTEIPFTYDKASKSNSVNASGGVEFGAGGLLKAGIDITGSYSNVKTGVWREGNLALNSLGFSKPVLQFREANEASVLNSLANFNAFGGADPIYYATTGTKSYLSGNLRTPSGKSLGTMPKKEENFNKSNQLFRAYTIEEVKSGVLKGNYATYASRSGRKDHHIGAITVTSTEGKRFIYGIAAYNGEQENYAFAVGAGPSSPGSVPELPSNLVAYSQTDMSKDNKRGIDNFYEKETTPAHAHSYLITEILSPDYIDNDGIPGATEGDFGMYHKFDYEVFANYKWRTPVEADRAVYSAGLYSDRSDDKASVTFGTKELWYVKTIESKNQIAIFHFSEREDGFGANDKNGGLDGAGPVQQKLDKIELFNKDDFYNGVQIPIKTVHFEYTYELCTNYSQNASNGGKLTLKKVFFTYENSNRGRYNAYDFSYGNNYAYNRSAVDRWGDYKPVTAADGEFDSLLTNQLNPFDEPYTIQDEALHNQHVSAWKLNRIDLPSGGRIEVEYEANRYRYVQNKAAMTMFKVVGITTDNTVSATTGFNLLDLNSGGDPQKLVVEVGNTSSGYSTNINDYLAGINKLYFRAFMRVSPNPNLTTTERFDYVPGYCDIDRGASSLVVQGGKVYIILALQPVGLKDNGGDQVNPICLAAINFARNYLSTYLPPSGQQVDDGMAGNAQLEILKAVLGSIASFAEVFTGPNQFQFISGVGKNLVANKSYVRLYPGKKDKLGGGCRVKSVKMYDNWSSMSSGGIEKVYGQEYKYELEGGGSSGVAQYEPQIGGEENPFKTPVIYSTKYALAPDKVNYQETPFGESFFPSASVGYSRVEVQSLSNSNVRQNSTGKIVNEFFTARDFPTKITRSNIIFDPKSNPNKHQAFKQTKHKINLLFFSNNTDKVSVSQGFVVENNDMHGKQKKMTVYAERLEEGEAIVSSVVYDYALNGPGRLDNTVQVVRPNGSVEQAVRGLNYDAIADFRESKTTAYSGTAELNVNVIPFLIPIPIPLAYASVTREKTEFRSASVTKAINRFGILEKTTAEDLGSVVVTENLAYDSETGSVLLTKTKTNFNDDIYSLKIPAHWMYSGMGQAYKSGLLRFDFSISVSNGVLGYGSNSGFHEGDEILIYSGSNGKRGWLRSVSGSSSYVVDDKGNPLQASGKLVVLRSGRRNMQSTDVATIISRSNPLPALRTNQYQQVLQASAIEFESAWRNGCGCDNPLDWTSSTNPYYRGEKGRFKPQASYSYLTKRTQTFENGNSNVRDDGFFEGFNPFYKNRNGNWVRDYDNWTFASEIRNINENGMAVETADALFRYTATLYGFNKTLPRAIAVNSRRYEIGAEDFEDQYPGGCSATEFRFSTGATVVQSESHSGRNAVAVPAGGSVSLQRQINFLCPVDTTRNCQLTLRVEKYDPPIDQFPRTDVEDAYRVYMDGGSPSYSFSGDLVQGELVVEEFNASGGYYNVIFRNGADVNEYFLTVTDSEGCSQTVRLYSSN